MSAARHLPLSKLGSFFAVLLLLTGRCYGAETWTILLLLRWAFTWYKTGQRLLVSWKVLRYITMAASESSGNANMTISKLLPLQIGPQLVVPELRGME